MSKIERIKYADRFEYYKQILKPSYSFKYIENISKLLISIKIKFLYMEVWEVREYKNFDDLVQHNKSLFKEFSKTALGINALPVGALGTLRFTLEKRIILKTKELEKLQSELGGSNQEIIKVNECIDKITGEYNSIIELNKKLENDLQTRQ